MKIAIVGGSPSSVHLAPFDNPEWEIWTLGNQLDKVRGKRITRIFEIHEDLSNQVEGYADSLAKLGVPLVVSRKFPVTGPHIDVYPFEIVDSMLGMYLTSSAAYMMAMAIHSGATEIGIYGFDMAVDDAEYFYQRPCMEAWIGFAQGRGIKITIPDESPVLKSTYVEGITEKCDLGPFSAHDVSEAARDHQAKADALHEQMRAMELQAAAHDGARQVYERLAKVSRAIEGGQDIQKLSDTVRMR